MLRAPPGPQVSTGRIRVDAARAIAKLREYQLADRTAWVLEAIRAAVASGGTQIALTGDADDVWLRWRGAPWPTEALRGLFDELVSPEPARDAQHLRLLAAAVNSALGSAPAYVDLYAIPEAGDATRVRYTPDLLDGPPIDVPAAAADGGDHPLARLVIEPAAPPDGAFAPGMVVHLHRPFGLGTISRFVRGAEQRELGLARVACRDLAVPAVVGDGAVGRDQPSGDVVRLELGEGLDGHLAILGAADAARHGTMDVAERGVVLATYRLALDGEPRAPQPVRLYVDAPRMPTNASRSDVRRDSHPISAAEARARALWPALCQRLGEQLAADPALPGPARTAAIQLIASAAGTSRWPIAHGELPAALQPLGALPLVKNAVGVARPLTAAWNRTAIHTDDEPLPADREPWLGEVLWAPPDDAIWLLLRHAAIDSRAMRRLDRHARRQARARERFLSHAPREAVLRLPAPPVAQYRIGDALERSCMPNDLFHGLTGEVSLRGGGQDGTVTMLLDGRTLDTIELRSPIAFDAVIDGAKLTPDRGYKGALQDAEAERAQRAALAGAVRAAELLALQVAGTARTHEWPLLQAASTLAAKIGATFRIGASPLHTVPLWTLADGRAATLLELAQQSVIGTTAPNERPRLPVTRTIAVVDLVARQQLRAMLPAATRMVHYTAARARAGADVSIEIAKRLAPRGGQAALIIDDAGFKAAIRFAEDPLVEVTHVGVALASRPYTSSYAPCVIAIESDVAVPDERWAQLDGDVPGPSTGTLGGWERALIEAVARRLCGDPVETLITPHAALDPDGEAARGMFVAIATFPGGPAGVLHETMLERLRDAKLWRVAGATDRVSVRELCHAHVGKIPWLTDARAASLHALDDWRPLVGDDVVSGAVAALADRGVVDATPELELRRERAAAATRLAAHRTQGPRSLVLTTPGPHVAVETMPGGKGVIGIGERPGLELEILIEERYFTRVTIEDDRAIRGVFDLQVRHAAPSFEELLAGVELQLGTAVRGAIGALLEAIAAADPLALAERDDVQRLAGTALSAGSATADTLAALPAFRTVQGGRASVRDAGRDFHLPVAAWTGAWIAPADGEAPDPLDAPLLQVAEGTAGARLRAVLARLDRRPMSDVTDAVRTLQHTRRVARGLVPRPTLTNVLPEQRRRLEDLGDAGRALGVGDAAMVDADRSWALLHDGGEPFHTVYLDGRPAIAVAIEDPALIRRLRDGSGLDVDTLATLSTKVAALAPALIEHALRDAGPSPARWLRVAIRRAVLAGQLAAESVLDLPIFETTTGAWESVRAVRNQVFLFTHAWFTDPASSQVPLDDRRFALRLAKDERMLGDGGLALSDGTADLELDATARKNQNRPRAVDLSGNPAVAKVVLARAPVGTDGWVGILPPSVAIQRAVYAHKDRLPFEPVTDPCGWPTVTWVDEPALVPDRTWTRPNDDDVWKELATKIRAASDEAIRTLGKPPVDALSSRRMGPWEYKRMPAFQGYPDVEIRGHVWLDGAPGDGVLRLLTVAGEVELVAPDDGPLGGWLMLHEPNKQVMPAVLQAMCRAMYPVLVKDLIPRVAGGNAHALAHVRYALRVGALKEADLKGVTVAPEEVAAVAETPDPPRPEPATAPAPEMQLKYEPARPRRPPHVLDDLVTAVKERMIALGVNARLVEDVPILPDEVRPLARHTEVGLVLAGANPVLLAVAADGSEAAVDAVCAHLMTVLNVALTDVTDAGELAAIDGLLR